MSNVRYIMSFTTGGLFQRESVKIAGLYLEITAWDEVRDRVITDNLLQARTVSTLKRVSREVIARLRTLSPAELEFLVEGSHQEQASILWIAICRRHRFIAEFSTEVLRERYITLKPDLNHEEFDSFFNRKSEWHEELDDISPTTRSKLRQVLFRMLREAGLLSASNMINASILSRRLLDLVCKSNKRELQYFPVFELDTGESIR